MGLPIMFQIARHIAAADYQHMRDIRKQYKGCYDADCINGSDEWMMLKDIQFEKTSSGYNCYWIFDYDLENIAKAAGADTGFNEDLADNPKHVDLDDLINDYIQNSTEIQP